MVVVTHRIDVDFTIVCDMPDLHSDLVGVTADHDGQLARVPWVCIDHKACVSLESMIT